MNNLPHINGYSIERLIASGGTADVYLAVQEPSGRRVALKVLMSSHQLDSSFTDRFLKEARLIASLQHPNIITIYDVGVDKGQHYIAMELVEGGDLDRQIQGKAFNPLRALAVLRDVAACLQFVHERGIIHRDVKPANVLFRNDGSLVLTDFGIAKLMADDVKLTQTGSAVGSPAYSSPEQSQGQAMDPRSDIYSLGVMFLEMLLGYNPYRAETYASTSMNHIQMAIPRLEGNLKPYQDLIYKMLAKQPADRFRNMDAILAYLANPPSPTWVKPDLSRLPIPRSTTAWMALLSTTALLTIAVTVGWKSYEQRHQVQFLLAKAEAARVEDKLLTPAGESALDYYRQVLEIDGQNPDAKTGIQALANYYLALAREAQQEKRYQDALIYATRGLSVNPYDVALIDLKGELERNVMEQQRKSTRQITTKPPPPNKTRNFFQRLFD